MSSPGSGWKESMTSRSEMLLGMDRAECSSLIEEVGEPSYRVQQIMEAVYRQRAGTIEEISTLALPLRRKLSEQGLSVGWPVVEKKFVSQDGTVRYLIGFADGQSVEIVGQVCAVLKDQKVALPEDRINLVFMGMGEPFLNYDNFMKAIRLLVEEVGIAESRMTVSTAGIVPRIHDFGLEAIRPKLAISLNASNDKLRERVMQLNRKWNLEKLLAAARDFTLRNRATINIEYVVLREVNDSPQNAEEVVELLQGLRAKVNLIALNPGPGIDFQTPAEDRVATFQMILVTAGIPT